MIPVPPLDGSHVMASILPSGFAAGYQRIGFLGILVLLVLMRVPVVRSTFWGIVQFIAAPFEALVALGMG